VIVTSTTRFRTAFHPDEGGIAESASALHRTDVLLIPPRSNRGEPSSGVGGLVLKRAVSTINRTQCGRLSGRKGDIQADDLQVQVHRHLRFPGFARATHEICSSDRASNRLLRAITLIPSALLP
jgi:hypothetical protein